MRSKPKIDAFLSGGDLPSTVAQAKQLSQPQTAKVRKLFALSEPIVQILEERWLAERRHYGRAVTLSQVVEKAIQSYTQTKLT